MTDHDIEKPSLGRSLSRGLRRKCPCCGQSSSFRGYLKVVDECPTCHTPLGLYPCDDGPAYITMIIIGHVIIAPLFMMNFIFTVSPQILVPVLLGSISLMTLLILPIIKGAFLALLWHLGLKTNRQ